MIAVGSRRNRELQPRDRPALPMGYVLGLVVLLGAAAAGCTAPPSTTTYTEPQLKYMLLDHYDEDRFFYCDPDYYPLSRSDEQTKALEAFPAIQNNTAEFDSIVNRTGLLPPFSDAAKLAIYREHKRLQAIPLTPATGDSFTYSMQLGTEGEGRRVSGVIRTDGTIAEQRSEAAILTCPICLAECTRIETPQGSVPVNELAEGTSVLTLAPDGAWVAAPVLRTAKTAVPAGHVVVRLELADGRTVTASPGHPTTDGRTLGALRTGDLLDGSAVLYAEPVPYDGEYVYDLLPAGPTGSYRADGIPLNSTLRETAPPPLRPAPS